MSLDAIFTLGFLVTDNKGFKLFEFSSSCTAQRFSVNVDSTMATTNLSSRAPKSRAQLTGSGSGSGPEQPSEWKEGSIVSLKLKNFLVYKNAKAIFGPRLNMVVGPNGSGKSTLVCAIALGLGGSPKVRRLLLLVLGYRSCVVPHVD